MSKFFGKQELVVWYSTEYDYYTIESADCSLSYYVAVSKPFTVEIEPVEDEAEIVNSAKIAAVDERIAEARAGLELLKDQRANLLALPGASE